MPNELDNEALQKSCENNPYSEAVAPLTKGLLAAYDPAFTQIKRALDELTEKESMLLEQVHNENLALSGSLHSDELSTMFSKIELYQTKLTNIKKDMKSLHDKTIKLKKRALKIQQFKEKQDYIKEQKEAELKMEQNLIGKPNTNL